MESFLQPKCNVLNCLSEQIYKIHTKWHIVKYYYYKWNFITVIIITTITINIIMNCAFHFLLSFLKHESFQRFFIVFVLWASIGGAVGSFYILMYLMRYMESNIYPFGWLKLLAPIAVIRWIISYEIFTNSAICVLFSICTATSVVAIIFFGSQVRIRFFDCSVFDFDFLSFSCSFFIYICTLEWTEDFFECYRISIIKIVVTWTNLNELLKIWWMFNKFAWF